MKNSDKKAVLKSYLLQQAKIKRLYEMMPTDPEQEKKCRETIAHCKLKRQKIENCIDRVKDELLREVLYQKYVCGKTLEEIAFTLNYSKRHIERLHIAALEKLEL